MSVYLYVVTAKQPSIKEGCSNRIFFSFTLTIREQVPPSLYFDFQKNEAYD